MRLIRTVLIFAIASLVAGSLAAAEATGGLRYSITVSKFDNKAGWSGRFDLGDAWSTVLTDLLNQTGKFIVLGEKDMRSEAGTAAPKVLVRATGAMLGVAGLKRYT